MVTERRTSRRVLAIAAALALAASCVDRLPDQDLRILTASPSAKLPSDLLLKAFQQDASSARRTYFGKVVEITGTIGKVGTDAPGDRYVMFGDEGAARIRANLLDDRAASILSNVPENRRMTLRCYCEGLSGDVILKSCIKP